MYIRHNSSKGEQKKKKDKIARTDGVLFRFLPFTFRKSNFRRPFEEQNLNRITVIETSVRCVAD